MKDHNFSEEEFQVEKHKKILEHFNVEDESAIDSKLIGCELDDRVLVAVRDPNNLNHLQKVINETDTDKTDIVVMIGRVFVDKMNTEVRQELKEEEQDLFSRVVDVAEHIGKPVYTVIVPTNNAFFAIMNAANSLNVREVIIGLSAKYKPDVQLQQLALLWGTVNSDENKHIVIRIITEDREYRAEL